MSTGTIIDQLSIWDNPPEEAAGLVAAVFTDDREGMNTAGHWYDVLQDQGLAQVVLEDATA